MKEDITITRQNACGSCRGYNKDKKRCELAASSWYLMDRYPLKIACPAWEGKAESAAIRIPDGGKAPDKTEAGRMPAAIRKEPLPGRTDAETALVVIRKSLEDAAKQMALLADMMRATNERMSAMEQVIRTLEKVTPQQTRELNRAIMDRAKDICEEYRMGRKERAVAGAIRTDIRLMTGTRNAKEIPRCDYKTVLGAILDWDNYAKVQEIRKKVSP